ncbi:hypothetical protein N7563_22065 [Leclercia adecarboxylata ATCC 23216 = NBRC 102595]|nr:hypothetical protein [Leclercia adecarboxylata ATCC 23216 = NBRC 102595]
MKYFRANTLADQVKDHAPYVRYKSLIASRLADAINTVMMQPQRLPVMAKIIADLARTTILDYPNAATTALFGENGERLDQKNHLEPRIIFALDSEGFPLEIEIVRGTAGAEKTCAPTVEDCRVKHGKMMDDYEQRGRELDDATATFSACADALAGAIHEYTERRKEGDGQPELAALTKAFETFMQAVHLEVSTLSELCHFERYIAFELMAEDINPFDTTIPWATISEPQEEESLPGMEGELLPVSPDFSGDDLR